MTAPEITATPDAEYEAKARSELTSYIVAKLGLSHSITPAHYADYPLDDLWRFVLALHGRTRLVPFLPRQQQASSSWQE